MVYVLLTTAGPVLKPQFSPIWKLIDWTKLVLAVKDQTSKFELPGPVLLYVCRIQKGISFVLLSEIQGINAAVAISSKQVIAKGKYHKKGCL